MEGNQKTNGATLLFIPDEYARISRKPVMCSAHYESSNTFILMVTILHYNYASNLACRCGDLKKTPTNITT
jgi:hypothetical protein